MQWAIVVRNRVRTSRIERNESPLSRLSHPHSPHAKVCHDVVNLTESGDRPCEVPNTGQSPSISAAVTRGMSLTWACVGALVEGHCTKITNH